MSILKSLLCSGLVLILVSSLITYKMDVLIAFEEDFGPLVWQFKKFLQDCLPCCNLDVDVGFKEFLI